MDQITKVTPPPPLPAYWGSERQFRRYENYIVEVITNWPNVTEFAPVPPVNSIETLATRLRVAKDSLHNNRWETKVDMVKFIHVYPEFVVSTRVTAGKVSCGPKDKVKSVMVFSGSGAIKVVDDKSGQGEVLGINITNPDKSVIQAIITLHHHQALINPSVITTSLPLLEWIEGMDVSVQQEGNTFTIL